MVGLIQRFASSIGLMPRPNPNDERFWSPNTGGGMSRSGVFVTRDIALGIDVVEAVMMNLAGTLASLPLMVFKRVGKEGEKEPARDHPLYRLLHDRPNDRQTSQEFREELFRDLAFDRESFYRIDQDASGDIADLIHIPVTNIVDVKRNPSNGRIVYTFNDPETNERVSRDQSDIWHIRRSPLTADGLRAKSMLDTHRDVFGRAIAIREYGDDWFRNNGMSGGTLEHPGTFKSKEDQKDFLATWREGSTAANRHRDRLLLFGVKYNPIHVNNEEAQFHESENAAGLSVCRLWNMPPHRVGILNRATFSNIEFQGLEFVVYTLAPFINGFEQAAERDLILRPGGDGDDSDEYFLELNVAGLLRGDIKARYGAYAVGRQWGWLSVNDIRRLENLNSIENGDIYLEPLNMKEAGDETPPPTEDPATPPEDGGTRPNDDPASN
ncbi:phage portal protein, HK97 family [Rhizobiales bacterium GAS188]|nr:phage portal protein, HK97 family [Rhizobiales bacterium GAS188]